MTGFVIRAISAEIAGEVRRTMRAPLYGHPVHREVAGGTGPCRVCLNTFTPGEDQRLLFTFNPFGGSAHLAQPGPVFIHADDCAPARSDAYPDGLRSLPVIVEAHYMDGTTSAPLPIPVNGEADALETLLASPRVSFLHMRHAEAGCFIARVESAAR